MYIHCFLHKHTDELCATWCQSKVPSQYTSVSFNSSHSQTATSTASLSYRRWALRCRFCVPNNLSVTRCHPYAKQCNSAQLMLTPLLLCQHILWTSEATLERLLIPETRKWLWLFVSCCELQNPSQIHAKIKKNASMYNGITFKVDVSSLQKWLKFKLSENFHLIFTSYGSVHTGWFIIPWNILKIRNK
jgi:hypothetical protein